MAKNELSKYFGNDYNSNPKLDGLNPEQKSNFTIIVKEAKDSVITCNSSI